MSHATITLAQPSPAAALAPHHATVRRLLTERRVRAIALPPGLFRDPAWDMLLDLADQAALQRRVPVTSLAIAAGVPLTTGLRYIETLAGEGLVQRRPDPLDDRRTFVDLTGEGAAAMGRYLQAIAQGRGA
jgi:DNA-binding MarR family transcriptional regulator